MFVEWMIGNFVEVVLKFTYIFLNCWVVFIVTVTESRMLDIYMMFWVGSSICNENFWVGDKDYGLMQPFIVNVTLVDARFDVARTWMEF